MEKRNSQPEHGQPKEQTRCLFYTCDSGAARCQSQHPVSLLVSLAAVNQICVIHGTMNDCKILNIHLRLALKM